MRNVFLAIGIAAICSAGAFAADDRVQITLKGCVNEGTADDTYVLTNVSEVWPAKTIPAEAVYWLSTTKGLSQQVGHQVEVTGTYSPKRDEGKTGKVKIQTDRDTGEVKVAVENGMKKAEIKTAETPVGTSGVVGTSGKVELTKPYRRLEVQSLRMIKANCR